jgi:hypothetical protein
VTSTSSLPSTSETTSDAATIRVGSRPTSYASTNSGRPSSFAVIAALEELRAALAAPNPTPEVLMHLQSRIANLHNLARSPGELPTPPSSGTSSSRNSTSSLPMSPIAAPSPGFLDPSSPRRSLPVRGRQSRG